MSTTSSGKSLVVRIVLIVLTIFLFLFALDLMSDSFKHLSKNAIEPVIHAASNPFVGLFIGLLVTAVIQSSSTTTTMVVTAVASGSLSFADAVPIIMGANIGTTITSTIVSLGFIGNRDDFKRALSAGVAHDFFNILVVLILFPLEIKYQFLSSLSQHISSLMTDSNGGGSITPFHFKLINLSPLTEFYTSMVHNGVVNLLISFILLFISIKILARIISHLLMGDSQEKLANFGMNSPAKSFLWGTLITTGIQSSSVTTSVVVPFVATNKISLRSITPFIMGANIGTTITAFIAVFFKSYHVVNIAMVHLIFNVIGVLIFMPFPWVRELLVRLAEKFATLGAKYRLLVFIYILLLFFIIPFCLIYFTKGIEYL